ncbi:MAG: hypothetical protein ABGZ53_30775 [Fuerstiella sp.]
MKKEPYAAKLSEGIAAIGRSQWSAVRDLSSLSEDSWKSLRKCDDAQLNLFEAITRQGLAELKLECIFRHEEVAQTLCFLCRITGKIGSSRLWNAADLQNIIPIGLMRLPKHPHALCTLKEAKLSEVGRLLIEVADKHGIDDPRKVLQVAEPQLLKDLEFAAQRHPESLEILKYEVTGTDESPDVTIPMLVKFSGFDRQCFRTAIDNKLRREKIGGAIGFNYAEILPSLRSHPSTNGVTWPPFVDGLEKPPETRK